MITLSMIEQQIHRVLLDRARSGDPAEPLQSCLTYLELGRIVDPQGLRARGPAPNTAPPFRGLNIALGHISWYEFDHGRPMLSALVVNAETRRPGDGFADLARQRGIEVADPDQFWREQVTRSVTFWSGADVVYVLDAAMARVMDELAEIRRLLRAAAGRGVPAGGPPPRG